MQIILTAQEHVNIHNFDKRAESFDMDIVKFGRKKKIKNGRTIVRFSLCSCDSFHFINPMLILSELRSDLYANTQDR